MSSYARLILDLCDEQVTVNLQQVEREAFKKGFSPRAAKMICLTLGVKIRA